MRLSGLLGLALSAALIGTAAFAEALSNDELLKLFQQQRDAFAAAKQSGQGKTRGLTLMTIDSAPATSIASGSLQTPALDAGETALPGTDGAVTALGQPEKPEKPLVDQIAGVDEQVPPLQQDPAATIQPVVFGALAPELQVNVFIRFPFDSATLTPDQEPALTQMCTVMKASDIKLFRIAGHTDASGTAEYNQKLSQLRAEEVQRYLVGDCGIAADRLEAIGLGEQFLSDPKDPKAAGNRRVEFQALS